MYKNFKFNKDEKKDSIIFFSEYIIGLLMAIVFSMAFANLYFIYSFAISSLFIFLLILLIMIFDKKIVNSFENAKNMNNTKKHVFLVSWILKFSPLFALLTIWMSISFFSLDFTSETFLVPVITSTIIIFTSEFLKFSKIRKFSSNNLNFMEGGK